MSPDQNRGGKDEGDEQPRADETQEHELGDDFTEDDHGVDEELDDEHLEGEEPDDQGPDDEEPDDEDLEEGEKDDLDEDDEELEHVVSAETQEWDGLEAAEAEGEAEKTLVSSAGDRVKHAGSSITSSFERVGHAAGPKITTGFKAVRRHVRFPMWLRFLTASLVIIASIAGATSASLILYLSDIANALKHGSILNGVQPFLKTPGSGPQTILILGSDKRNQQISGKYGLSDTTMLLRLDPDRNAIALLSLPRDLKVDIPGVGTDKLNAAYSLGGPKLTLQTVKQITGLDINHLVNVDFTGFARAVNAIGCVYVDVDHRYYHKNSPYAPLPRTTRRSTSNPATRRSAGLTPSPSRATATPTTTSFAPPASRRSCVRPARRCLRRSSSRTAASWSRSSPTTRPRTSTPPSRCSRC